MIYFFDASALVKRYSIEEGTEKINEIFDISNSTIIICNITLSEVISCLNRLRNEKKITYAEMLQAQAEFFSDYINEKIGIMDIERKDIIRSIDLIHQHNLKSSDAIIFASAVNITEFEPIFVCSDKRLLKAAEEKYFKTLNPAET